MANWQTRHVSLVGSAPAPLRRGDRVAVVAPSGPLNPELLTRGLGTLTSWGLAVEVMPHSLGSTNDGMFAGSDEARAGDLEDAWCLPEVRAVFCARGGYGAGRIVDRLDWDRMLGFGPKWLVGSSDVTALHQAVYRRLGLASIYGPMPASEVFAGADLDVPSIDALRRVLFAGPGGLAFEATPPLRISPGYADGVLVGGNLALVASGIGTSESVTARDAIAFLEDVGEPPYRVDRMLTQLLRSGWFDGVRGVALGTFYECGDVMNVVRDRLSALGVPVVGGFLVGHGPVQHSLPLGLRVRLDADNSRLVVIG